MCMQCPILALSIALHQIDLLLFRALRREVSFRTPRISPHKRCLCCTPLGHLITTGSLCTPLHSLRKCCSVEVCASLCTLFPNVARWKSVPLCTLFPNLCCSSRQCLKYTRIDLERWKYGVCVHQDSASNTPELI
ncbi:UNVERIFIED_CONTAM: hypothetical protein Sradi_7276800 [Sesamum radiatum]|uniref:Secreted protein n=1 Tax=Sesamum radiatum TaxID=300843 RepID=A0AAW2IJQ0_SESRA